MFSGRLILPVPAFLAVWAVVTPAHADVVGSPVMQSKPIVSTINPAPVPEPEDVKQAAFALKQACETWRRSVQLPASTSAPVALPSSDPRPPPPDLDLCDAAVDPEHAMSSLLWIGGWLGVMATVCGLAVSCALRGLLLSLWNWRLPIRARPW